MVRLYLPDENERLKISQEVLRRVMLDIFLKVSDGMSLKSYLVETVSSEIERWLGSRGEMAEANLKLFSVLKKKLLRASESDAKFILSKIVDNYLRDIHGHFSKPVYFLATKVVPSGLSFLFNSITFTSMFSNLFSIPSVKNNVRVYGEIDLLKKLQTKGTVILTPTHVSHMDSPIMGWVIYDLGMPPFLYGAGLNLFENPFLGFFIRNLGAYRLDRKRKHELYLNTLKEYVSVTLEKGFDHLFFPGGTRSRSGLIETKLKLGLLGSGLNAYIQNLKNKKENPNIYIVPCVLSYHITLEAESLIDDYLQDITKEDYIMEYDESYELEKVISFIRRIFEMNLKVYVRIGRALDPFGNYVDDEGNSTDPRGRIIDPIKYVLINGEPNFDHQRDAEYTREVGKSLSESFLKNNFILSTGLCAFVVYNMLRASIGTSDVMKIVRSADGVELDDSEVIKKLDYSLSEFLKLEKQGEVSVADRVKEKNLAGILDKAYRVFSSYHREKPPFVIKGSKVIVRNPKLLLYYANRLAGYDLERKIFGL